MRVTPVASEASFDNGEWQIPVRLQMQRFAWNSIYGGSEPQTEHAQYTAHADKGKHESTSLGFCVTLTSSIGTHAIVDVTSGGELMVLCHWHCKLLFVILSGKSRWMCSRAI